MSADTVILRCAAPDCDEPPIEVVNELVQTILARLKSRGWKQCTGYMKCERHARAARAATPDEKRAGLRVVEGGRRG